MKQRHRYVRLLALIAVLSLVAAGCANDDDSGAADGDTTDSASGEVDCATVEFGCVEVGADEPLNIGTLLVLSGADQTLGQDALYGVQLALDYLDGAYDQTDGTLLDHPVELASEDELCTAEGGQAGATALAADTSIVAVIGTSCSSAALGVADTIFSDKGMLLLSPSNTNPALTTEGTHEPFYARTAHNDRIQGAIVAEFSLAELGGATSAATIADESPYTQGLTAAFEQNFEAGEGSISGSEQINSLDTDFQPVLRTLAEGDPDVLYFPVFVAACTLLIQQAQEILPDTALIVSDGCLSSDTVKNAGDAIDGVYASSPDLSAFEGNPAYADEFIPAYLESFNEEGTLSVFHAHAFDAANILFDAIEQVAIDNGDGSLSIPRQALRDAVFATSAYEGLSGTITCTELGDCATDVTIGIFEAPGWPVEGGDLNAKAIYSDTKSLDDVL